MYVFKVKWSNPGKGVAPFPHLGVVAIEKGAFWSPSTTVTNFTWLKSPQRSRILLDFWPNLANWLLFQNLLIFIYLNSGNRWRWYHLAKLLRHILKCPKFTVFVSPMKLGTEKIRIHFGYILAFLCWTLCTRLNFSIWLTFPLKDFS